MPRCLQGFRSDWPPPTRLDPTQGQMIGHYGRFGEIQSSLIKGDLAADQVAAQSLAERSFPPATTSTG